MNTTAAAMGLGDLAERMGSEATLEDALRMQIVLFDMGLDTVPTAEIEEGKWLAALRAACTFETRWRLVHTPADAANVAGWYLCLATLRYANEIDHLGDPIVAWDDNDGDLLVAAEYDPGTDASEAAEARRLASIGTGGLDFSGPVEMTNDGLHMIVAR